MRQMCDVNVLLALVVERHTHHVRCAAWWKTRDARDPLLICREVQAAFIRWLSNRAVMGEDVLTLAQAWAAYASLLKSGCFARVLEPRGLDVAWERFCRPFGHAPKVVMDAYLAAFAIAGDYTLVTLDEAFAKFRGVSLIIPADR
jgi:toxin-antitoxin system PIN domain toxin